MASVIVIMITITLYSTVGMMVNSSLFPTTNRRIGPTY